jgi:lipoate synthase
MELVANNVESFHRKMNARKQRKQLLSADIKQAMRKAILRHICSNAVCLNCGGTVSAFKTFSEWEK